MGPPAPGAGAVRPTLGEQPAETLLESWRRHDPMTTGYPEVDRVIQTAARLRELLLEGNPMYPAVIGISDPTSPEHHPEEAPNLSTGSEAPSHGQGGGKGAGGFTTGATRGAGGEGGRTEIVLE